MFVWCDQANPTAEPDEACSPWDAVHVEMLDPAVWTTDRVLVGLQSLERIEREVHAARALLVVALPDDRDAVTRLTRATGISHREARRRRDLAAVVAAIPEARALLAAGVVGAEHLVLLRSVVDKPGVGALAQSSVGTSPEAFARTVEQFRLALEHGEQTAARQKALRRVRFFSGPEGMIGLSGLLPPSEGATLRSMLRALVDARWKAAHPDRAPHLGGHGGDEYEQRMADALLELTGVSASIDDEQDRSTTDPTATRPVRVTTAKPATVVIFDIDKYEAEMLDHGPVPVTSSLFDQAKAELYLYFKNAKGEILQFGRTRRDPSFAQRLAVMVRDGHCIYPDCEAPASACSIHHLQEWLLDQGFTDVEVLGLFCDPHHRHLHVENLQATREADGSVTIRHRTTCDVVALASPKRRAAGPPRPKRSFAQ